MVPTGIDILGGVLLSLTESGNHRDKVEVRSKVVSDVGYTICSHPQDSAQQQRDKWMGLGPQPQARFM